MSKFYGQVQGSAKTLASRKWVQEMDEEKLKRCPFCGGLAEISTDIRFGYTVRCSKCGITTRRFEFKQDAVDSWNKRKKKGGD